MRNKFLLFILLLVGSAGVMAQNKTLGIGTASPNPNAALHVESPTNNQGLIIPRMTTAQRTAPSFTSALTTADIGLLVFDTDLMGVFAWEGAQWGDESVSASISTATGNAGYFAINNPANMGAALYATTNGAGGATSAAIVGETATAFSAITGRATGGAANAISGISSDPGAGSYAVLGTVSAVGGGQAAVFNIANPSNPNNTLEATTLGTGGAGKFKVTNAGSLWPALWAETNSNQPLSAAIYGLNTGTGDAAGVFRINNAANNFSAVYAETNGKTAGRFVKTAGTGPAVYIDSQTGGGLFANHNGPTGYAGIIQTINTSNTAAALYAESAGTGPSIWALKSTDAVSGDALLVQNTIANGSAGSFEITEPTNTHASVYSETIGSGAAVYGKNIGAGNGFGGLFEVESVTNTYPAIQAKSKGTGPAIRAFQGSGDGPGPGMDVLMLNPSSTGHGLVVNQQGLGIAGNFEINNAANTSPAINATTNAPGIAINGNNSGPGNGFAGHFTITNATNSYQALKSYTNGAGPAGTFEIINGSNTSTALLGATTGTGNAFVANHQGASGNIALFQNNSTNVARIDKTGQGFFNGGTVSSGADVAEMFDVEGARNEYEPGDVLIISESTDRTVEKSITPNSTKVAGVYATKPGVLLTEKGIDENLDALVPMGVVGVIPTKVCLENGPIKRGDLLVTSSTRGHAMKAVPVIINGVEIYPTGAILGKALENFESGEKGLIKVLVNVK